MKINVTAELNAVPLEACDDFFCVIIRCNKCVAVKGYYLEENVHYSMSVCSRRQVLGFIIWHNTSYKGFCLCMYTLVQIQVAKAS